MNFILIIISLILSLFAKPAYAVDSSNIDVADIDSTIYVQSGTPIDSISLSPIIENPPISQDSTENRQAASLKNEVEDVYEIKEDVTVELFNFNANTIETVLVNDQNKKIEAEIDQVDKQGITTLTISPPQQLKPGKYTLEIIDQTGSKIEQDFLWGVLAINPNKSIYNSGETANLAMAVLDESGNMVCDAKLTLIITDPDGKKTELSTENNKIIINQTECNSSAFTLKPDYQTSFLTFKTGKYLMELTSETKNGTYTINDSFEVQSNIDFEVERISATRIYPFNNYPMTINIKANQDFNGDIYEEIPDRFELIKPENELVKYTFDQTDRNTKKIKWSVNLKKGELISLKYQYKAPNISPQFYLIGPLELIKSTNSLYKESRSWQIASDAVTETFTAVGTTAWVAPAGVFSVHVQAWGAGGGGGDSANQNGGGGGGGGAYVAGTMPVTPGNSYDIVVGAGGSGGVATNLGANGNVSSFNSASFVAAGGKGGGLNVGGSGGLVSASVGTTKNAGGKGGNPNTNGDGSGGGGGAAGPSGIGISGGNAVASVSGGVGGKGNNGIGGSGGTAGAGGAGGVGSSHPSGGGGGGGGGNGSNGGRGGAPGAGGGGGEVNTATATGANGQVVLTYTANLSPNAPNLVSPANSATGISLAPPLKLVATDPEGNNVQYKIILGTDAAFTGTTQVFDQTVNNVGWSGQNIGTSAYSSGTTATYTIQSNLDYSTMYYWKGQAKDYASSNTWGNLSVGYSFTTMSTPQLAPEIPTLSSPNTGTTAVPLTPSLVTVTTDLNNDNIQYKIELCTNQAMSTGCTTFDQTTNNIGWSGMNVGTSAYSSGTTATYTLQSNLGVGTSYFWRSYAKDYSGSNTWSSTQPTPYSFVTFYPSNLTEFSFRWRNDDGVEGIGITSTFDLGVTYPIPNNDNAYEVVSADFNQDGQIDLATANNTNGYITVFNNTGSGTFDIGVTYSSIYSAPKRIISSDINNDGYPDLITLDETNYRITLYPNNGSGGFDVGTSSFSTTGTYPKSIVSFDVENDGDYDLVVAVSNNDNVAVYKNNGTGNFAAPTTYTCGNYPSHLFTGDFNRDGYKDLAVAHSNNGFITIKLNNRSGAFSSDTQYSTDVLSRPETIDSLDINEDGYEDLVVGTLKIPYIFVNNGNGTFGVGITTLTANTPYVSDNTVVTTDANNDGKKDIVIGNNASYNRTNIFINNGDSTFGVGFTLPLKVGTSGSNFIITADVNNDGKSDLVSTDKAKKIIIYTNTSTNYTTYGTFSTGTTYPTSATGPYAITSTDINNDGKVDLATANNTTPNSITVFLNTGSGTFGTGTTYPTIGADPTSIIYADFNSDGKPDLATANNNASGNITVFLNTGSGTFGTGTTYPTIGTWTASVTSGDFNSDGKSDLATANPGGNNITIFSNNGDGTFGTGTTYPSVATGPESITSADLNNDGKADLVTANYNSNKITVFLNTGTSGTFGTGTTYPTLGVRPESVTSADFNNDGKADLVTSNTTSDDITVFLNTGTGTFGTGTTYPTGGEYPYTVTSTDINSDGKVDLVTSNRDSSNITVFLNQGSGAFGTGVTYPTIGTGSNSVTSADINLDGKSDLITANVFGNNITVFTNLGTTNPPIPATWLAAENIGITNVSTNSNVRLRFSIGNTGTANAFNFRLQVAPLGVSAGCTGVPSGNFSDVPTSVGSAVAVMTTSPNFTNQESTTNQLTDSGATFIAGKIVEHSSNQTDDITLGVNHFTEAEYNFQMTSNAGSTTPYCFRAVDIASTLNTYTQIAQLTTFINRAPSIPSLIAPGSTTTFTTGVTYPTVGTNPKSVTSTDVNSDGKSDLITANYGSTSITVFLNTGSGTFDTGTTYPTVGLMPYSVTSADVNSDGKSDLITANIGDSGTITVFTNTGSGTFTPVPPILPLELFLSLSPLPMLIQMVNRI